MPAFSFLRYARAIAASLALCLLASCGGVESGGTGAPVASVGPISGFGSVIVNRVRFDERNASVLDDDGAAVSPDRLKLGVTTQIEASAAIQTAGGLSAVASTIRISSELIGPVGTVNAAGSTFTVLGQTVLVTPATVFDAAIQGGMAGLVAGITVEVYGRLDVASGQYSATRVEPRAAPAFYKVHGQIGAVDPNAKTLSIAGQLISFAQIPQADLANVAVGNLVRVKLAATGDVSSQVATSISSGAVKLPDDNDAEVEGRITSWTSSRQFSIDGVPVDASKANFPQGEMGVVLGARVIVSGTTAAGVLQAQIVDLEGDESVSNTSFDLHGTIDALDPVSKTLSLRGMTVDFSGQVQYGSGTAADLAVGRSIEVIGDLSSDGVRIEAQVINFETP